MYRSRYVKRLSMRDPRVKTAATVAALVLAVLALSDLFLPETMRASSRTQRGPDVAAMRSAPAVPSSALASELVAGHHTVSEVPARKTPQSSQTPPR
jgi:hypothetical protein